MTFIGWLLLGAGVLFGYAAVRNLKVACIMKNVLSGQAASCTNS